MAYTFNGINQWLGVASAPVANIPLSLSARFRKTGTAVKNGVFLRSGSQLAGFYFGSGQSVRGYFQGSSTADWSLGTYTTGQDTHVCITASSATSRSGHLGGGSAVTNTMSVTMSGFTNVDIGAYSGATTIDGDLSEIAIWDAALAQDEVVALAKGAAAYLVKPHALRFYAPLIRDLIDVRGARAITNHNSASVTAHPRIFL
jgi:hypothetical protein